MSGQARVESVEALKKFRAALCKFAETAGVSLDEAEAEIQRTRQWVSHDQQSHWKRQLQKRTELYTRAKSALTRKKLMKTPLGGRYSTTEEEKALAVAERRLEEARQKIENVRKWRRVLDDESRSYQAVAQGVSLMLQADLPSALAQLDNMIAALEAYAVSAAPAEQRSVAEEEEESGYRPEPVESMARGAPVAGDVDAEWFERLRSQTPEPTVRAATPVGTLAFQWAVAGNADALRHALSALSLPREPVDANTKVVLARGVWDCERIYLERVEPASTDDSGWYIGIAEDTPVSGCDAVRVADLLARRPDLDAVLQLAVGYLVVLDGASLAAVLDPQGVRRGPAAQPPGDV